MKRSQSYFENLGEIGLTNHQLSLGDIIMTNFLEILKIPKFQLACPWAGDIINEQVREGLTECWAAVRDKVEFAENGWLDIQ